MTHPTISEVLVRDHQHQMEARAARHHQIHELTGAHPTPLRTGAGRMLVRTGLWLAQVDRTGPAGSLIPS